MNTKNIRINGIYFYFLNNRKRGKKTYYISECGKYFAKNNIRFLDRDNVKRETYFLKYLQKYDWCPRYYGTFDNLIITEHCGNVIGKNNFDISFISQLDKILIDLNKENIKHNDIKGEEFLTKNKKLYLIDYEWSSIGDDFSCNGKFDGRKKIKETFIDSDSKKIFKKIMEQSEKKYKNPKRKTGSQKEIPKFKIKDGCIEVLGYQKFKIKDNKIFNIKQYSKKFNDILDFLKNNKRYSSIYDIGCSNGLMSFMSYFEGFEVCSLDHDEECLKLIDDICKNNNLNIETKKYSFGDFLEKKDIVIMGALIHWIYSCTSLYGNFDSIFKYLKNITGKYLIIEWVDEKSKAVKNFNHLSFNNEVHKEEYCKNNFLNSFNRYFKDIKILSNNYDKDSNNREIYLGKI